MVSGMSQPREQPRRVGPLIAAVGVVHVASTPVFFPASVRSIADSGVLGAVSGESSALPLRAAGFWYAMTGVALTALGWMVSEVERDEGAAPPALSAVLAGMGVVGAALDPRSGFWAFFPLAVIARRRSRRRPGRGQR